MATHIRTSWILASVLTIGAAVVAVATIDGDDVAWFFSPVPPQGGAGPEQTVRPAPARSEPPSRKDESRQEESPAAPPEPRPADSMATPLGNIPSRKLDRPEQVEATAGRPAPPGATRAARVLQRVEAEYPSELRDYDVEGTVRVEARVAETGDVVSVRAVEGKKEFFWYAERAMRRWKYEPALQDGVPVVSVVYVDFVFKPR